MSHRSPIRTCKAPDCDCGPSGDVKLIEEALKAEREASMHEMVER